MFIILFVSKLTRYHTNVVDSSPTAESIWIVHSLRCLKANANRYIEITLSRPSSEWVEMEKMLNKIIQDCHNVGNLFYSAKGTTFTSQQCKDGERRQ